MRESSLGAGVRIAIIGALLGLGAPNATFAETSSEAFERGDYEADVKLWRVEAALGSIDAQLRLGISYDIGRGVAADANEAFRWYLKAANGGHPDAQFNVAVMLDAGIGVAEARLQDAQIWYARAAANGHARAQYNLGLLYAAGDGVPQNVDLARYWFSAAATRLPAALDKLTSLEDASAGEPELSAPIAVDGAMVELDAAIFAELVWTAPQGAEGSRFFVELLGTVVGGGSWDEPLVAEFTDASSIVVRVPEQRSEYVWRVSRIYPETRDHRTSGWLRLGSGSLEPPENYAPEFCQGRNQLAIQVAREVVDAIVE